MGELIPSRAEMSRFTRDHPIVSIFGAISVSYASFQLIRAFTAPKGSSPYASSYELGHLSKKQQKEIDTISKELVGASKMHKGQSKRLTELGSATHTMPDGTVMPGATHGASNDAMQYSHTQGLGAGRRNNNDPNLIWEYFTYGPGRGGDWKVVGTRDGSPPPHGGQGGNGSSQGGNGSNQGGNGSNGDNDQGGRADERGRPSEPVSAMAGFGASTSTTTSTSSSHGMMPKDAAPTLLEMTGGQPKMFGGQKNMLRVPPSVRRRTQSSAGFGNIFKNIFQGKQDIEAKKEQPVRPDVVVHDIFGTSGLIPEMGQDMVVV